MLKNKNSIQAGFALHSIIVFVLLLGAITLVGMKVWQLNHSQKISNASQTQEQPAIKVDSESAGSQFTVLDQTDIATLQQTPVTKPAPASTTPTQQKTTTTSTSAPTTASTTPAVSASIVFSSDGCIATVTGTPGMTVEVGAFTPRKGGATTFTLPASGTKSASVGGIQNMTSYAKLLDTNGNQVFYQSSTITIPSCPVAG